MFQHQHSLRFLLKPEHYFENEHWQREIDELFRPTWQFACSRTEVSNPGDFLTLNLFGVPVIIRNFDGQLVAFENVCTHRHCLLTCEPAGNSPALRCQYHGWEFNREGRTAKIPEAQCFRPWDRDNSRLNGFAVEECGDLVFVRLTNSGPALREWMAPFFEETAAAFGSPIWQMRDVWDYDCSCNWKVPCENTLESYHVTVLHPDFFGHTLPPQENVHHQLDERFTALDYDACSRMEEIQARFCRWLGGVPTNKYRHRHIHPNTILVSTDTVNYVLMYLPLSATTVRIRMRFYAIRGIRRGPIASTAAWIAWRYAKRKTLQVHREDIGVYASQQQGLQASRHRGVLGAREERIYAFQQYLVKALQLPIEADPATYPAGS